MSTTPYRPSPVPSPAVRRLDRPARPASSAPAPAVPRPLVRPQVVVRHVEDEVSSLRRQLADLRTELARYRA